MLLLLVLACEPGPVKNRSGSQLLEAYYHASCDLMTTDLCIEQLGDCGYPTSPYGDVGDCINSHLVSHQHCSNLAQEVEAESEVMEGCLAELEEAECDANTVCPDDTPIFRAGYCEQVLEIFAQHCNGFSW